MTEQKAIEVLKYLNFCGICTTGPCGECERKLAKEAALIALEEIQKYRSIATCEWIPCCERLPEEEKYYFVTLERHDNKYVVEFCLFENGKWYIVADGSEGENNKWKEEIRSVIAWMPLPEPYKPKEISE